MAKSWLITGASGGLGAEMAKLALKNGHSVVATARHPDIASRTHPEILQLGGVWKTLDVTDKTTAEKVKTLVDEHDIDVVVNNAGFALLGAIEDIR